MTESSIIVTLCFIVLLPIVPAYLLFRLLASHAAVSGKLQSLKIKLGGAFAGYFAVVALLIYTYPTWHPQSPYQLWKVKARVVDDKGAGIQPLDLGDVSLTPPYFQPNVDGSFTLTVSSAPGVGSSPDYPTLNINHKDFGPVAISLDPKSAKTRQGVSVDDKSHEITISEIQLRKLPDYSSVAGQVAQAIPAPAPQEGHQ